MELGQTHLTRGTEAAWGVASMVDPLRRVFVRTPVTVGEFAAAGWQEPDPARLLAQHRQFVTLLESLGCEVDVGTAAEALVDAAYTHDPVIMTPFGAIVLQMVKPIRRHEPELTRDDLTRLGVPILGELTGRAVADGGDKVWFDRRTLAIGHGYRTNGAAIAQVRELLAPHGVDVISFDLPHFRGAGEVLHLMSVISPLDHDLAAVYEPLAPVRLLEFLAARGISRVPVDDEEFVTQGANILAVAPRVVVMAEGNPRTARKLHDAGCEVHEFPGGELCVKGGGGPTCLTQPLRRD
jgi:dimethylargininase